MGYVVAYLFRVLLFLIVFSAIAFLAFTGTRLLGKRLSKGMRGKVMQVVESISLGIDRQLHLVRIGSRYYLIPSSGKNLGEMKEVEMDSASLEKLAEAENGDQDPVSIENDFREIWNKVISVTKLDSAVKTFSKLPVKTGVFKKTSEVQSKMGISDINRGMSDNQDIFRKNLDRLKKLTQDK